MKGLHKSTKVLFIQTLHNMILLSHLIQEELWTSKNFYKMFFFLISFILLWFVIDPLVCKSICLSCVYR